MENSQAYDFELKTITTDPDLNKYNQELKEDLKISKMNIRDKAQMVSGLRCKWLNRLTYEREEILKKLLLLRKKYSSSKLSSNKFSDPLIQMKAEVALENGDSKMLKVDEMIKNTKARIEFLERAQNILNDLTFTLKNIIEIYKLEGGM